MTDNSNTATPARKEATGRPVTKERKQRPTVKAQKENAAMEAVEYVLSVSNEKIAKLQSRNAELTEALRAATGHINHMAAWITLANRSEHRGNYSFESLGEDMPGIRAALEGTKANG